MSVKILIVEDEMLIGHSFKTYLEQQGCEVTDLVATGEAAMASLAENQPDVILLDILLKRGENGVDLAKAIREKYQMPIIFTTGNSLTETQNRTLVIGRSIVLTKPVDLEVLKGTIDTLL